MDGKQRELLGVISKLLFAIIVATGMIIAARIFSNAIADRPLVGSFNGSLSQSNFGNDELMDIEVLRNYLSMYPTEHETIWKIQEELQRNITSGTWPDFPYVQLGDRLYFNKKAVDDWFYEQGKARLSVK